MVVRTDAGQCGDRFVHVLAFSVQEVLHEPAVANLEVRQFNEEHCPPFRTRGLEVREVLPHHHWQVVVGSRPDPRLRQTIGHHAPGCPLQLTLTSRSGGTGRLDARAADMAALHLDTRRVDRPLQGFAQLTDCGMGLSVVRQYFDVP